MTRPKRSTKPAPAARRRPRPAARPVAILSRDIVRSRTLGKGKTWVVAAEVHVKAGVTLTVADGATILVANGVVPGSRIRRAALVFDPGSRLRARRLAVKACGPGHRPEKVSDNGGVWFLGTYQAGASDGIAVRKVPGAFPSSFRARSIRTECLGRGDPRRSAATGRRQGTGDDIDGFKLIGVGPDEWGVGEVRSHRAADDGFCVTNSRIAMDRLVVVRPAEDGMNVSSSRVEIRKALVIRMETAAGRDRDLFDLETDDGASYVELLRGCRVEVSGGFGDQLQLVSRDMPKPVTRDDNEARYRWSGRLRRDALVFSVSED